jgi:hypothetical protein
VTKNVIENMKNKLSRKLFLIPLPPFLPRAGYKTGFPIFSLYFQTKYFYWFCTPHSGEKKRKIRQRAGVLGFLVK